MEYIVIVVLILVILILVILFLRNKQNTSSNDGQMKEQMRHLETINRNIIDMNKDLINQMNDKNTELIDRLNGSLNSSKDSLDNKIMNYNSEQRDIFKKTLDSLDSKIAEQNKTTNKNVENIVERVSKLDSVGKEIVGLNENISNLEKVLADKKARGTFGEIRLHQIFAAVFGENQPEIYEEQVKLPNNKIVDFMLHAPKPLGNVAIDSKFPLENYNNIVNSKDKDELEKARRRFRDDMKKHINDIKEKYIIEGETANQAIMFIPAEAIFAEINAFHPDVIDYSYKNNVWITSPSTLMSILNLLLVVAKDMRREEASREIHEELIKLRGEFDRYEERWGKLVKRFYTFGDSIKEVNTTSKKISKRFDEIEKVNFSDDSEIDGIDEITTASENEYDNSEQIES